MIKPTIEENELKGGHQTAVIWQAVTDGVAEPAIFARTFDGGDNAKLVELQQEGSSILLNGETIPELFKLLKRWV